MVQVVQNETPGAVQTLLTTELNALANAASVLSGAIDNTAGALYMNLELYLGVQTARSAGACVNVEICPSVDGTNYCDATFPCPQQLTQFNLDAAVTARYVTRVEIPIPPTKFKLNVTNNTGQAFAGTTNTLKYTLHSNEIQ
jgi:hypothetical protein